MAEEEKVDVPVMEKPGTFFAMLSETLKFSNDMKWRVSDYLDELSMTYREVKNDIPPDSPVWKLLDDLVTADELLTHVFEMFGIESKYMWDDINDIIYFPVMWGDKKVYIKVTQKEWEIIESETEVRELDEQMRSYGMDGEPILLVA